MTIYIALLRGINVGGHNKIKMAELRSSLEQLRLQNIKTYIQSGNILFESSEPEEILQKKIHNKIEEDFGISSSVIIRTAEELQQIVNQSPFSDQMISEASASSKGECLHVALLEAVPSEVNSDKLLPYINEKELCVINGRDVYLLFYDSIRNSKLANNLKKLEVPATVRNWKTITKLSSMVEEFNYKQNK
ncbi:DUF1697 domain-containing protein [Lederbergia wuyishanensis]|uniref:Uncharacterized protein (DUF1697 family) n=1 Tax=Lederbergia wuyishanensis TaxID=1347903 RepID=A0ABU0D4B0_9BACI|nr:DUF1697 domain-containing protein [Lederbergia wuyishanensis]MCJ8008163.1 DUF1697 domain-containing protein [Lederbergia wuyishanensis]MDQ0343248.1 uncharacterized protein (DUF1697 family) [Lederbergia wuyishanensis]